MGHVAKKKTHQDALNEKTVRIMEVCREYESEDMNENEEDEEDDDMIDDDDIGEEDI